MPVSLVLEPYVEQVISYIGFCLHVLVVDTCVPPQVATSLLILAISQLRETEEAA